MFWRSDEACRASIRGAEESGTVPKAVFDEIARITPDRIVTMPPTSKAQPKKKKVKGGKLSKSTSKVSRGTYPPVTVGDGVVLPPKMIFVSGRNVEIVDYETYPLPVAAGFRDHHHHH
jgi:hypothetical protein